MTPPPPGAAPRSPRGISAAAAATEAAGEPPRHPLMPTSAHPGRQEAAQVSAGRHLAHSYCVRERMPLPLPVRWYSGRVPCTSSSFPLLYPRQLPLMLPQARAMTVQRSAAATATAAAPLPRSRSGALQRPTRLQLLDEQQQGEMASVLQRSLKSKGHGCARVHCAACCAPTLLGSFVRMPMVMMIKRVLSLHDHYALSLAQRAGHSCCTHPPHLTPQCSAPPLLPLLCAISLVLLQVCDMRP